MEPLIFLAAVAIGALTMVVVFQVQDTRRAREDERRWHNYQRHLRTLQGPEHGEYLRDVNGRPE